MESLNTNENDDNFSGNELDELLGEDLDAAAAESKSQTEDQNDNHFSDNELDELLGEDLDAATAESKSQNEDENDDQFADIELDDLIEEDLDATTKENQSQNKNQNDDQPLESGIEATVDGKGEFISKEGKTHGIEKIFGKKQVAAVCFVIGLCLLTGMGYFYRQNRKQETFQVDKVASPAQVEQSIVFDSFVVPFMENDKFTYISLSISIDLTNSELNGWFIKNKAQLRGIIYDILLKEINRAAEIPPVEQLKEFIVKGVNNALSDGVVNKAYIMNFLAV